MTEAETSEPAIPIGRIIRRLLAMLPALLTILAIIHPVARVFARWDWRLDLLTHFQEPAFAITLLAAVSMLLTKRRRMAVALLALAAFQVEPVVRFSLGNPVKARPDAPRLRVLYANVLFDNRNHLALARLINETNPDIVALVEISPDWMKDLGEVARAYPYRAEYAFSAQGLSLWFKKKPYRINIPELPTPDGWPYLRASFDFDGVPRHLWLIHPASPMRRLGKHKGFPELDVIANRIRQDGGSTMVMGDFNTTDGSPYFRDFATTTGLRDSRLGFGRQGSWPVGSPYRIAIDHAFVSNDLAVVSRRLGPSIGSDHRPVILEFAPAEQAAKTGTAQDSASAR